MQQQQQQQQQKKKKKILTKQLGSIPSTFLVPLLIQPKKNNFIVNKLTGK